MATQTYTVQYRYPGTHYTISAPCELADTVSRALPQALRELGGSPVTGFQCLLDADGRVPHPPYPAVRFLDWNLQPNALMLLDECALYAGDERLADDTYLPDPAQGPLELRFVPLERPARGE